MSYFGMDDKAYAQAPAPTCVPEDGGVSEIRPAPQRNEPWRARLDVRPYLTVGERAFLCCSGCGQRMKIRFPAYDPTVSLHCKSRERGIVKCEPCGITIHVRSRWERIPLMKAGEQVLELSEFMSVRRCLHCKAPVRWLKSRKKIIQPCPACDQVLVWMRNRRSTKRQDERPLYVRERHGDRTKQLVVRLSEEEFERLKNSVVLHNERTASRKVRSVSMSQFVRDRILSLPHPRDESDVNGVRRRHMRMVYLANHENKSLLKNRILPFLEERKRNNDFEYSEEEAFQALVAGWAASGDPILVEDFKKRAEEAERILHETRAEAKLLPKLREELKASQDETTAMETSMRTHMEESILLQYRLLKLGEKVPGWTREKMYAARELERARRIEKFSRKKYDK